MRKSAETYEAKAKGLNLRGMPYGYAGKEFPPDAWVTITEAERDMLQGKAHLTIRKKADGADSR
jgi:hypothetical protein